MSQTSLVRRKISLSAPVSNEQIQKCITSMRENEAIQNVEYGRSSNTLSIEYDQLLTNYSTLLAHLSELDIAYKESLTFKLRKNWYDYLDANTRENALAPPASCCNKPPKKTNLK